jgi:probable rRNA maturation factor
MIQNSAIETKLLRKLPHIFRILRRRGAITVKHDPSVHISLAPNSEMRTLKKKLLHKDAQVVDVLAFPDKADFPHPESKTLPLGDVLINEDIAGNDFPRAVFLFIHGLLHLLGYQHEKKRDIIVMEKLEQEILEEIKKRKIYNF